MKKEQWSFGQRIIGSLDTVLIHGQGKLFLAFWFVPLFLKAVQSYTLAIVPLLKGIVQQILRGVNTKLK
jgi:uncharacterized membrane protein